MAPRDYKNRGRAPRKPAKKQPEKTSSGGGKVIIVGLLAIIMVGGFGYGLWTIKGAAPKQDSQVKTTVKQTQPKAEKPLPEKPVEKWQYIEELQDKQVEVEVPQKQASTKRYQMQCHSFKSREKADTMKAQIAFLGIESFIKQTKGSSWFRVVLGPYKTKRDAEVDRHKLQDNGHNDCKIWLWNWD